MRRRYDETHAGVLEYNVAVAARRDALQRVAIEKDNALSTYFVAQSDDVNPLPPHVAHEPVATATPTQRAAG